jgi:hypothetical protein
VKNLKLFTALLALALLMCLSGVQGQYTTSPSGYSAAMPTAAQNTASQYSQYYQMLSGPAPGTHISVPVEYNIAGNYPSTVYFSNQMQPVNYATYQSNPMYAQGNSLWIQGTNSWTQYAVVPQGATVPLLAITPAGGTGNLYFMDATGLTYTYNYYFYPYSQMTFYADVPGRHTIYFVVNGKTSNQVVIDVTGTYVPPTNYYPPRYYAYDYGYGYFPGFFPGFVSSGGNEVGSSESESGEPASFQKYEGETTSSGKTSPSENTQTTTQNSGAVSSSSSTGGVESSHTQASTQQSGELANSPSKTSISENIQASTQKLEEAIKSSEGAVGSSQTQMPGGGSILPGEKGKG